jgi:beta-lactamase regulating signal transducer with metallopeptidase domain
MESLVHAMLSNALAATVLALSVAILGRACRRPALIHGLWLVVMLKLVTPPVVPVSLPIGLESLPSAWSNSHAGEVPGESITLAAATQQDSAGATESDACDADVPWTETEDNSGADSSDGAMQLNPENQPARQARGMIVALRLPAGWRWEHLVLALVLSGAVAWWLIAFVRIIRFNRLMNEIDPAPEEWQTLTAELAGRLGLGEAPRLYLVPGRVPPMLWAIGSRPRLLVPSELWPATSIDQRTSLLLHELAHLKRRDHWVRWLELIVGGLYWWHPAVWWGRRLLREAEEQCCDAWVVWAMPKGAKTYATALLAALEFVSGARPAPAASSATSGNGHVSCLKRRLKMIVRAQTPKGLSWVGRLAVMAAAAFLLPLAPSWGQKSDADEPTAELNSAATYYEYNVPSAEIVQAADQSSKLSEAERERLIREEFVRDPDIVALGEEIAREAEQRDHAKAIGQQPNDPARRAADLIYKKLMAQYESAWKSKSKALRARYSQDDAKKDEPTREDKGRETAERFEEHVKDLIDKLMKELGPVGEELCNILEKSVDDLHETLKKEGIAPDDLRKALEKSHNEMRKSLEKGGSVNKELRETVEKSRRDLQEEWERARNDLRMAMRDRVQPRRQQERVDEAKKDADQADSAKKEAEEIEKERAELEKVRSEVRALEQQLRQATRRLGEMQRRTMQRRGPGGRRGDVPSGRVAPGRAPADQPSQPQAGPRPPRSPGAPAAPASPRRVEPPVGRQPVAPRRPQVERERPSTEQQEYDKRLRNLDDKLEELLKEVKKLKEAKKPQESQNAAPRRARSAGPGTPVAF